MTPEQAVVLTTSFREVSSGAELLAPDLSVVEDISDDSVSWSAGWKLYNKLHRTCTVRLTRPLRWGVDLVRLYQILTCTVTGVSVRWNVGVFCLTTPERVVGETPETYEAQGFDRLTLLDRPVGDDYAVLQGVTYRQALLDAFAAAGVAGVLIEGASADAVLPVRKDWPLVPLQTDPSTDLPDADQEYEPTTWLRVVNDLQRAWNGRGVYCDDTGRYRCEAYRDPASRPPLWTFDADIPETIVGEDRTLVEDVWDVPNRWVAIAANPPEGVTPSRENGLVQVRENLSDGPTSQAARVPAVWPKVVTYEAATPAALSGLVDRRVALDRRVARRFDYSTAPFPAAGHADIFDLRDEAAGARVKVQAVSWDQDSDGSNVRWSWEAVT